MAVPNFGQMKELYTMQKKVKQAQKELKGLEIEASSTDNLVTVIISGELKITSIDIDDELLEPNRKTQLERDLVETIGQAMSRAQTESATRMQPLLKDLNFPGM